MEQRSHEREVRLVDPAWSLSELMARIAKALVSDGPALALTPISVSQVHPRISLIVTTTGSSGIAKEVGLSASALLSSAKASNHYLGAELGSTWSLLLPLNHIAGINVLIRSLESGTTPTNLVGFVGRYPAVDFTSIVPTQLYRALHGDQNLLEHLQGCKAVLVGGAALTDELRSSAHEAGISVIETYGSSETSGGCVYNGTPLDGVEIKVDEQSRIAIGGRTLAHSYINSDLVLQSEDGWYYTSDFGQYIGGCLTVDGRIDDVVITGGENVSLAAIDKVIAAHFPEIQAASFAVTDPQWGQAICCAIVGADTSLESSIQELLEREISSAAKIKKFLYLDELPLLGIGKIDRAELGRRVS